MGFYPVQSKIAGVADGYHLFRMGYTSLALAQYTTCFLAYRHFRYYKYSLSAEIIVPVEKEERCKRPGTELNAVTF